jgi:O-antigen/teichoic acid export membrane protein
MFLTGIAQRLANLGIPATCSKYMAEYLGRQEYGVVHEVFRVTFRYQAAISGLITAAGLCVAAFADADYRIVSALIVASMWPAMISYIPAQANVASENLRSNIPASLVYLFSYTALVTASLIFRWGLIGLASATLIARIAEAVVRFLGVHRWVRHYPRAPLPPELKHRMLTFSRQNLVVLALGLVVWDRSEVLFLKHFCDVKEVAFYSLAFSIVSQLLMVPRGVSSAIGVTILAQYGRDPMRLKSILRNATRYVSVLAVPVFLGIGAISEPLIRATYGTGYLAVVAPLRIMSVFAIPRAFQTHTESLLQATERQGFIVRWLVLTAFANLLLDALLIPKYGAIGAAAGNGIAQTIGVAGLFFKAGGLDAVKLQLRFVLSITAAGCAMVGAVLLAARLEPPVVGVVAGIVVGMIVFAGVVVISGSLDEEDKERLAVLLKQAPLPVCRLAHRLFVKHSSATSSSSQIAGGVVVRRAKAD